LLGEHTEEVLRTAVSAPTGRRTVVATANEQSRPEISKHGKPFALTGVRVLDLSWLLASGGSLGVTRALLESVCDLAV
jgi:hypothetical protein